MLREGDMWLRCSHLAFVVWAGTMLLACGDDVPAPGAGDPGADSTQYQPRRIGLVQLLTGAGGVVAELADRADPLAPEVVDREGECLLYARPEEGDCATPCPDGVCSPAGECSPRPHLASAGIITVTGLRQTLRLVPGPQGYQAESPPPADLFAVGASIRVSAQGAAVPPFSAQFLGVPPLELSFDAIELRAGRPTRLTWTAAGVGRVSAELFVGRPGAPYRQLLLCETDDNGSISIPSGIAARLRSPASDEEVSAQVTRLERSVIAVPSGPIEIVVGSRVPVGFDRRQ